MVEYPNIIKLNVRGTQFQTRKVTLTRIPNYFKEFIEKNLPLEKDDSGAIFIDRPPKHFDKILDYMSGVKLVFPDSKPEIKEILVEAHAYQMEELVKLCEKTLRSRFYKALCCWPTYKF